MEYDNFDLKQIFIKTYKNITVDDVKIFYNTYFIKDKKYIVVSI
jgi:hypothetical protein